MGCELFLELHFRFHNVLCKIRAIALSFSNDIIGCPSSQATSSLWVHSFHVVLFSIGEDVFLKTCFLNLFQRDEGRRESEIETWMREKHY